MDHVLKKYIYLVFSEPYVDSNVSKELAQNTLEKLDDR